MIVPNTKRYTRRGKVRDHIQVESEVLTDAHKSYLGLAPDLVHNFVDHAEKYAEGHVHTNGLENFWSLLERCIHGTYIAVEPFHLLRYLDEQSFRYNNRKDSDAERFGAALAGTDGRLLTYKTLIGESEQAGYSA